ncbi:MAG: dehydrogenase [Pseudonocardiales bacterium]|nr:MAG: dehydrogenase [Pseudonocardiales bacterium]
MALDRRSAIVTGAAGGIGAAIAQRMLEEGLNVVVTDIEERRLDEVAAGLRTQYPNRVIAFAADANRDDHIGSVIDGASAAFGFPDVYIANAGVLNGFGLETDEASWDTAWAVNVMSHVRAARRLVPRWLEASAGGCFVSTASAAGLLTQLGSPVYSATKHATVAFAEWLAATYGDRGIQVCCLCPMGVRTSMLEEPADAGGDVSLGLAAISHAGEVVTPLSVADALIDALQSQRFLALPHTEVAAMYANKAADPDRWLAGMHRYRRTLDNEATEHTDAFGR